MPLELPDTDPATRAAVEAAVRRAGIRLAPEHPAAASLWLQQGLREAVDRSPVAPGPRAARADRADRAG